MITLLLLFMIINSRWLVAQEVNIQVQQFGIEEGLLHRNVAVYKDRQGFLWLSSSAGLQRYDGYSFKTYDLRGEDNFLITTVGESETGEFWLLDNTTKKDFLFFNPEAGVAKRESDYFDASYVDQFYELLAEYPLAIIPQTPSDEFYFQGKGEIIAFSFTHGVYKIPVPFEDEFNLYHVSDQGQLWVGSRGIEDIQTLDAQSLVPGSWDWTSQKDLSADVLGDELYVATEHFEAETNSKFHSELNKISPSGEIQSVFQAKSSYTLSQIIDNRAWFIGEAGWMIVDLLTDQHIELLKTDYGPELFGYMGYRVFHSDGPNRTYTSSPFGFNIIDIQPNLFTTYFNNNSPFELPFSNSIRGIYADEEDVYFFCENQGLVQQKIGQPEAYQLIYGRTHSLAKSGVGIALLKDKQGDFWIPATKYLDHYDAQFQLKEQFNYAPDISPDSSWNIKSWVVFEDQEQCIWISDYLALVQICKGEINRFSYQPSNQGVLQILQKDANTLWLCSRDGLKEFDIPGGKFTHTYNRDQEGEYRLPATNIKAMLVEENGDKWLASDRGLIYWSAATGEKRLFSRLDGLSNDNLYAVYADEHNRLWLSSDYGIMSFDKTSHLVTSYLPKDGIGQEEFNRVAHFQATDGRIYFGGLNGITAFHPDDFQHKEVEHSAMVLSEFELFDGQEEALINKLAEANRQETINFRPSDRFIKLSFSLPTFEGVEKILYGWKIDGVYDDWSYQKENFLQFASLPYGHHTLRIKGQSSSTGWSPHELAISIQVIKPIYLRTWFLVLSLLALIAGVITFYRIRTRVLKNEIAKATSTIQNQAEELRQLDQLKSRFFANVSHELRTPLALMLGPIKRLKRKNGHDPEESKLLGFLERNTVHLKGLVNEILDLSKLENNKMELQLEPTPFYNYLSDHLSQFYSIGTSESINLSSEFLFDSDLVLSLDRKKFEKVLNNFLSNAIKFSPIKGEVFVQAADLGNQLLISVDDNGRGIHPDDLAHVFDRFYQSKAAGAPTEGGTGIGLSMCRELANLMGGKVWVESELGVGSTFYFQLPKQVVHEAVLHDQKAGSPLPSILESLPSQAATPTTNGAATSGKQILIVEDNPDLREYYKIILSDYQLHTTEHGQQALDYLAGHPLPDLIISDLMMPVMDGMQLLDRLKSSDAYRHLPVIMLTAKSNQQVKVKALRYGIDDYLNKPFDEEELRVRIHNLLVHQAGRTLTDAEPTTTTDQVQMTKADQEWLEKLESYILEHLEEAELSVGRLGQQLMMSESTLLRQLKRLTGLTPKKYLQELRLNQAREYLQNKKYKTVAEVSYRVGYRDAAAFTRSFKKRFGKAPTEIE